MTIHLITQEEYDLLLKIQEESPILTFQNKGFEYIDKSKFTELDEVNFKKVTEILSKAIVGFSKFNNFCHTKGGELRLRFQYDWTADDRTSGLPFTGVGYLILEELFKGFREKENTNG